MDNRRINQEADIMTKILMARGVRATIALDSNKKAIFLLTPSTIVYQLRLEASTSVDKVYALQDDFCSHINRYRMDNEIVPDDFQTSVRVDMLSQTVEINRPDPEVVDFGKALAQWDVEPMTAFCGLAYTFKRQYPVVWRLNDAEQPHVLIAGTTGSGKTNELMSILLTLSIYNSPDDLAFSIIDMKRSKDLRVIESLPHVVSMAREPGDALSLLRRFHAEMENRERGTVSNRVRHVLIVDELATLTESDNKELRTGVLSLLNDIGRKCREANMNMILCTQSPKAKILGDQLKGLLALRLVGAVTSKVEANVAVNLAASGAEMLPGKGAMIYRCGRTMKRFQAPFVATPFSIVRNVTNKWPKRQQHATTPVVAPVAMPVAPVVAIKKQVEIDADVLREPWKIDASQAEMIRIMLGRPGDMSVNTGGANRKRLFDALELLREQESSATITIATTQPKQPFSKFSVEKMPFIGSSGSGSSEFKPM